MTRTAWCRGVVMGGALACLWTVPCRAVVDIRFERWRILASAVPRDVVAPLDSFITIAVEFDATATAGDAGSGLRFALAERDAGGNDVLARFEVQPCIQYPAAGSAVVVRATMGVYCDVAGDLRVHDAVEWLVNWCDLPDGLACLTADGATTAAPPGSSPPEPWEFVVLDENDAEGSFPTPDDVIECGPFGTLVREYVAPEFAASGSIGIFADSTGLVCSDRIVPFQSFRWYVVAKLDGLTRCGITVSEIGIQGLPPNVFVTATANPHAIAIDDPFGRGGLSFPCERGADDRVVLYTLDGIATQPVAPATLVLGAGGPPSNPFWPYPWVDLCPRPGGLRRRVLGGTFFINPESARECDPPTGVTPVTWGALKALYRD